MKREIKFKSKLTLGVLLATAVLFSQCKKDSDIAEPGIETVTAGNLLAATTSETLVPQPINISAVWKDSGYAYAVTQNFGITGDSNSNPTASTLRIFENGVELGPAHSNHTEIRNYGKGRFSHWGGDLYFSASDNSDPRTNGRKYTYVISSGTVSTSTTTTTTTTTSTAQPLNISGVWKDSGYAWAVTQNFGVTGDSNTNPTASTLRIFENGVELGPAHSNHNDIRNYGKGRFSHWGSDLYFSTSDNSDPRTNGRKYTYVVGGTSSSTTTTTSPTSTTTTTTSGTPIGYASVGGSTTGGQGGQTVTVSSYSALKSALSTSGPLIIKVSGTITGTGSLYVTSNKTIMGVNGGTLDGVGFYVFAVSNVIFQNLTIKNVLQGDGDNDCINIKYDSHHIWIDHCDLSAQRPSDWEIYDGLIDITQRSDYITISWNKLHDSHKAVLIGAHDQATDDIGHLRVTLYGNYFYNVSERAPGARFGYIHSFNNYHKYFTGYNGYATGSTMSAVIRTDNNYYEGINAPIRTDFNSAPGYISGANTNIFANCGSNHITTAASSWIPSYSYQSAVIPAANVPSTVLQQAGPR